MPTRIANPNSTKVVRTRFARICCCRVMSHRDGDGGAIAVVVKPEELARAETERAGDQAGGERLLPGVVGLYDGVVVPARGRDLVLGVGQLVLQSLEILAGPQLWVALGHREQPAQRGPGLAGRIGSAGHPLCRQRAGPG